MVQDMLASHNIVVMGDINLDWHTRKLLPFSFSEMVANGVIVWDQIDELPGGSGLNFARFARQLGYTPLLLAKIGNDSAGHYLYKWLQNHQLEQGIVVDTLLQTGKAFITRDTNDIRMLINNTPNANQALSVADVNQYAETIRHCKVLYVSGYCVMSPNAPRTEATLWALQLAREGGQAKLVFDVVPHQFYKIYPFSEFQRITRNVDILISEVATMRRYLNLGDYLETVTSSMAEETAELLSQYFDRFILRFGPSGCDEQVVWEAADKRLLWEKIEHAEAQDKRGFGDLAALKTLQSVFGISP